MSDKQKLTDDMAVSLFGRVYQVKKIDQLMLKQGYLACADYAEGTIHFMEDMDLGLFLKTMVHELWHLAQADFGRPYDEEEANQVSLFVHDLLEKNPGITTLYRVLTDYEDPLEKGEEDDPAREKSPRKRARSKRVAGRSKKR